MLVASPLWLAGLLAAPLIWWLHRAAGHGRSVQVPSLLPYLDSPAGGGAAAPARRADPAWLRRALAATALALALADISVVLRNRNVTVWLDDSLSMTTREAAGTRLSTAFAQLREMKPREHLDSLEIRSLSNPAMSYALDDVAPAGGAQILRPPPVTALRADREHWLATDGTSEQLLRWSESAPLHRVILTGDIATNTALTSLSARLSLQHPDAALLEAQVVNAGDAAATRTLTVWSDRRQVAQVTLQLAAAEQRVLSFTVPAAASGWSAALTPADALALDDRIELSAALLRPATVFVGAHCPTFIGAALRAVPLLRMIQKDAADSDASILCQGDGLPPPRTPALLLRPDPSLVLQRGPTVWSTAARNQLDVTDNPANIAARGVLPADDANALPLLRSPAGLLAARSQTLPRRLQSTLDFAAVAPSAEAQNLPLLIQLMELTLERPLLAPVALAARDPAESAVARLAQAPAAHASAIRSGSRKMNLSWLLLALAAALIAWDLTGSLRGRTSA